MTLTSNKKIEDIFEFQLYAAGLDSETQREYKFMDGRRWRFDFAFPQRKIAVEIQGGTWIGGRHVSGSGYEKDCEKYNTAVLNGWKVLKLTTNHVKSGVGLAWLEELLEVP